MYERLKRPYKNSHAYHFFITFNWCEFYLLTPSALQLSRNAYLKNAICKFDVEFALIPLLIIAIAIIWYCFQVSMIKCKT